MRASRWGLVLGALMLGCGGGTTVVYLEAGAPPMDAVTSDVSTACPDGQRRCGERCVDVNTDRDHCSSCGLACPAGRACTPSVADSATSHSNARPVNSGITCQTRTAYRYLGVAVESSSVVRLCTANKGPNGMGRAKVG